MNLNALHKIGYGMYIVGSHKGEKLNGQIANTVFQITSEPPTVAVSINKNNLPMSISKPARSFPPRCSARRRPCRSSGGSGLSPAGTWIN